MDRQTRFGPMYPDGDNQSIQMPMLLPFPNGTMPPRVGNNFGVGGQMGVNNVVRSQMQSEAMVPQPPGPGRFPFSRGLPMSPNSAQNQVSHVFPDVFPNNPNVSNNAVRQTLPMPFSTSRILPNHQSWDPQTQRYNSGDNFGFPKPMQNVPGASVQFPSLPLPGENMGPGSMPMPIQMPNERDMESSFVPNVTHSHSKQMYPTSTVTSQPEFMRYESRFEQGMSNQQQQEQQFRVHPGESSIDSYPQATATPQSQQVESRTEYSENDLRFRLPAIEVDSSNTEPSEMQQDSQRSLQEPETDSLLKPSTTTSTDNARTEVQPEKVEGSHVEEAKKDVVTDSFDLTPDLRCIQSAITSILRGDKTAQSLDINEQMLGEDEGPISINSADDSEEVSGVEESPVAVPTICEVLHMDNDFACTALVPFSSKSSNDGCIRVVIIPYPEFDSLSILPVKLCSEEWFLHSSPFLSSLIYGHWINPVYEDVDYSSDFVRVSIAWKKIPVFCYPNNSSNSAASRQFRRITRSTPETEDDSLLGQQRLKVDHAQIRRGIEAMIPVHESGMEKLPTWSFKILDVSLISANELRKFVGNSRSKNVQISNPKVADHYVTADDSESYLPSYSFTFSSTFSSPAYLYSLSQVQDSNFGLSGLSSSKLAKCCLLLRLRSTIPCSDSWIEVSALNESGNIRVALLKNPLRDAPRPNDSHDEEEGNRDSSYPTSSEGVESILTVCDSFSDLLFSDKGISINGIQLPISHCLWVERSTPLKDDKEGVDDDWKRQLLLLRTDDIENSILSSKARIFSDEDEDEELEELEEVLELEDEDEEVEDEELDELEDLDVDVDDEGDEVPSRSENIELANLESDMEDENFNGAFRNTRRSSHVDLLLQQDLDLDMDEPTRTPRSSRNFHLDGQTTPPEYNTIADNGFSPQESVALTIMNQLVKSPKLDPVGTSARETLSRFLD